MFVTIPISYSRSLLIVHVTCYNNIQYTAKLLKAFTFKTPSKLFLKQLKNEAVIINNFVYLFQYKWKRDKNKALYIIKMN